MKATYNDIQCQSYKVVFENPWDVLNALLSSAHFSAVFVIVDNNTEEHCYPLFKKHIQRDHTLIKIQAGEGFKTIETCQQIWDQLIEHGADRQSMVVNLGGGVIGDMGGFCASTYMRGIAFVQMPTTLLSQVDASVGSKLGVDFQGLKNIIGMFQDPVAVVPVVSFLDTLPYEELRSGFAEVLKHALIWDRELWNLLMKYNRLDEIQAWPEIIHRNIEIKKEVVNSDPKEKGLRKILNYGHTIGHGIESVYLNTDKHLLHGEAIAVGMVCEAYLASQVHLLEASQLDELTSGILRFFDDLPNRITEREDIWLAMQKDKKNVSGKVRYSLVDGIGHCKYNIELDKEAFLRAIDYYEAVV